MRVCHCGYISKPIEELGIAVCFVYHRLLLLCCHSDFLILGTGDLSSLIIISENPTERSNRSSMTSFDPTLYSS